MGLKISDMTPLTELSKNDMFEVTQYSSKATYSVSAQDISNFLKTASNGGFKGSSSQSADDFTISDIGTWWWTDGGEGPFDDKTTPGVMEIISYGDPTDATNLSFIQRLTTGSQVFSRCFINSAWTPWVELSNHNSSIIDYGYSTSASVNFNVNFEGIKQTNPVIMITPINTNPQLVVIYQLATFDKTHFTVNSWKSETQTVQTQTINTYTDTGDEEASLTSTITETTRGAWEQNTDYNYAWVAFADPD